MADSHSTVYLVTGANRGLGLGLVTQILKTHARAFVYAGTRDPSGSSASALKELEKSHPGRIKVVKYVAADVAGNQELAREIEEGHGRVDTVIANSAIANSPPSTLETDPADMDNHFHVNVTGPLTLLQTTHRLLLKSPNPRFIPISSLAGSMDGRTIKHKGNVSYGASKAALNWLARKIHFENEWLVVFPVSPGVMDTDMFRTTASTDETGLLKQYIEKGVPKPEDAALAILSIVDNSVREREGGNFVHVDGSIVPW